MFPFVKTERPGLTGIIVGENSGSTGSFSSSSSFLGFIIDFVKVPICSNLYL